MISHSNPALSASKPVKIKDNGNPTEGAVGCGVAVRTDTRSETDLTGTDMGEESTIGLLFGLGAEAALFELCVQMDGPTVGAAAQLRAGRQSG